MVADRLRAVFSQPENVLPLVLMGALIIRISYLDLPRGSLIFDESYYVNAARILLGWAVQPGAHYAGATAGLDPNLEHPPLGKLLIALSMQVFGDNGIGWRIPSVIASMVALIATYGIVRAAGESAWLGILVVALLGFENLTLVHSRIGTLDMMALAPTLVAAWLALRSRWAWAGVFLALGLLIKLTALYGLLAIVGMILLGCLETWRRERQIRLADLRPAILVSVVSVSLALAGLWAMDARYTKYTSPFEHVGYMFKYGANLRTPVDRAGICSTNDSLPWEWPFNQCQITYLRVDVTVRNGDKVVSKVPSIDFRGAMNPLLAGAIPLALLMTTWLAWRRKNRLALWAVVWAAATYIPYVGLSLINQRITYIYYVLPVIPALAMAVAMLLRRARLPNVVTIGFVLLYVAGFAAYFPFRRIP